jgi:hypothetical protein
MRYHLCGIVFLGLVGKPTDWPLWAKQSLGIEIFAS